MLSLLLSFDHHCHFRHFLIVIVIVILSSYSWSFMIFVVVVFSLVSFLDFVFSVFRYNPRRRKWNPPIRNQMINSNSNAPLENELKYTLNEIPSFSGLDWWPSGRARGSRSGAFRKFPVRIRQGILLLIEAEKISYYFIFRFLRLI